MKNHCLKLISIIILLFVCILPVMGQDATAAVDVPMIPAETIPDETPAILSLTIGEVFAIVIGTAGIFIAIGKILWDANQTPGGASVDTRLTERVEGARLDRDYMDSLERAYQLGNAALKTALDATVSVLQTVAPLTPLTVDDATLSLLKDIQSPGATTTTTTTTTADTGFTSTASL